MLGMSIGPNGGVPVHRKGEEGREGVKERKMQVNLRNLRLTASRP